MMKKVEQKLKDYQLKMSMYAEQHKIILANEVLDMIKELQEGLNDDKNQIIEQLKALKEKEENIPDDCDEDGFGDEERIYDDGRSQGRYEAYVNAIKIVSGGTIK